MTQVSWHLLAERDYQEPEGAADDLAKVSAAVALRLGLTPEFAERMQAAVGAAIQRARRRDAGRAVQLRISAARPPADEQPVSSGWGFFLVEKVGEGAAGSTVAVLLYPDRV